MKLILNFIFILITVFFINSCRKFVEIPNPPDIVIADQAFSTDNKATSVITSIYGNMINGPQGFTNYMTTKYPGLSADELDEYNPSLSDQEFITSSLTAENGWVKNFWTTAYKTVYYANAAIEGLQRSESLTPSVKSQLLGEVKFIRAFSYFYLVNLFGNVPLETTTNYKNNMHDERSPVSTVYKQIIKDLEEAMNVLSIDYPTGQPVRPNKYVAEALLARIYLYRENWGKADSLSTDIINSHKYTLIDSLKDVFLANSKEAIWQLVPKGGYIPELLNVTLPLGVYAGPPRCFVTESLLKSFELGDKRRIAWIDSVMYQGRFYYYPTKYRSITFTNEEYYMVFRYAEIFLIRAEARTHESDIDGAKVDLNKIRNRAGLPNTLADDQASLLDAIMHERRIEFFAEWGHRWFDLKRTGRIDSVLSIEKDNWNPNDSQYPIPAREIKINNNLVQNEGY